MVHTPITLNAHPPFPLERVLPKTGVPAKHGYGFLVSRRLPELRPCRKLERQPSQAYLTARFLFSFTCVTLSSSFSDFSFPLDPSCPSCPSCPRTSRTRALVRVLYFILSLVPRPLSIADIPPSSLAPHLVVSEYRPFIYCTSAHAAVLLHILIALAASSPIFYIPCSL